AYLAGTWTNQSVTVHFTCADTGAVQSGIATDNVNLDDLTKSAETYGTTVSSNGDCIDAAGNFDGSETFGPIQIDKTAPVISGTAAPAANANGWNKTSVTVTFTCADTGSVMSGIATNNVADDNQTLTAETSGTNVSSNGDCIDNAGNSDSSASVGAIRSRLTDTLGSITSPTTGLVTVSSTVTILGTASDTPSDIDTVTVNSVGATYGGGTFTRVNA